jgi:hypothetical protein
MAVCTNGARDNDDEEKSRDDACDAVQDDHGNSSRGRRPEWVLGPALLAARGAIVSVPSALDLHKVLHVWRLVFDGVPKLGGLDFAHHGQYGEVLQHVLAIILLVVAVVGLGTVENDARDVGITVGVFEDALGIDEAGVVVGVTADVSNIAGGDVGDVGEVCVVQVAFDLVRR